MARQIWLLRHAEAEPHGTRPDSERRLTARGERQSEVAGAALAALGIVFEKVLVSPKERAQQTALIAERSFGGEGSWGLQTHDPLANGLRASAALEEAAGVSADGRLLLVGHEPDLSLLAGELTGGRLRLRKGGLAGLRLEGAGGELLLLARPRDLALIAGARDLDV
jgi:phosphohistidine phosphatase